MRQVIPDAFHRAAVDVKEINIILEQNQLQLLPVPIQMAKAIIIIKTAVIATDYLVDVAFFFENLSSYISQFLDKLASNFIKTICPLKCPSTIS